MMADEQQTSAGTKEHGTDGAFAVTKADTCLEVPQCASSTLAWVAGDERIDYVATAGHVEVRDDAGRLVGRMFAVSYVKVGERAQSRPVTFCYNGGPGSSSVPVNFGGIGPKRVQTHQLAHLGHPHEVADNPHTLLRESDLVFLDALGTGYSVMAQDADASAVLGIDGDADAFARAICAWMEDNGRWASPLYLFGESYGTVRNAVLMRVLGERGVAVSGVVMLSAIFDWAQVHEGSDLYHLGMMPTMAAAARHFGLAGADVDADEWFDQAMGFAEDVLAPALLLGDRLPAECEAAVAEQMAAFIGLPADHVRRRHLRILLDDFRRNVLSERGKVCGRLDMRFTSDGPSVAQSSSSWFAGEDAADDAMEIAWTTAFRAFLRDEVGYRGAARYLSNNYERVGGAWRWAHREPGFEEEAASPNVAYDVACAMRRNPRMKVSILGGRYDAATPWWNVVHDMSCQFLSEELKGRLEWHRYGCGHMAYVDEPTLVAMADDLKAFYAKV